MQRAVFFVVSAGLCLLLLPVTPEDLRWVSAGLGVVYLLLALASFLDARSAAHRRS
jgi:hypothetical protein